MVLETIMKEQPEVINALYRYKSTVFRDGQLSLKQKELIAIGIICVLKCEECLDTHVQKAMELGATRDEIREAVLVAMYLAGPHAVVWSKKVDSYISDEFNAGTPP